MVGCSKIRIGTFDEEKIYYYAVINEENFEFLKKIYISAKIKPTKLIINSIGGNGLSGINIGKWVYQNNLTIEITQYCLSSCANYIFPSGVKKILHKDALLGWHGGYFQESLSEQITALYNGEHVGGDHEATLSLRSQTKDKNHPCWSFENLDIQKLTHIEKQKHIQHDENCLRFLKKKESDFFKSIGVDSNLPYYGQTQKYRKQFSKERYKMFYYSIEDMDHMGIKNIQLEDGIWTPRNNSLFKKVYLVDIPNDS